MSLSRKFHLLLLGLLLYHEDANAMFMWTAPLPAWNQTVQGADPPNIQTAVVRVLNGSNNFILRWQYRLLYDQNIALTNFFIDDGIKGEDDIGFVAGSPTVFDKDGYRTRFHIKSNREFSSLTINVVTERENATFQCKVSLRDGSRWAYNIRIEVTDPPKITQISNNKTVDKSVEISLICTAVGYPTPAITWTRLRNNKVVTMPLIITDENDGGTYRCTANNGVGNPSSKDVSITVHKQRSTLINVTMSITNEEYHEDFENLGSERSQSLIGRLEKVVREAFKNDSTFDCTRVVRLRPGSVIVIFVLTFKQEVTPGHAMSILKRAADSGKLGTFKVNSSSIVASEEYDYKSIVASEQYDFNSNRSTPVKVCNECSCNCTILIAVACTLVAIIIPLTIYIVWLHRKEARRKERKNQEQHNEKTSVEISTLEPNLTVPRQQAFELSSRRQHMILDEGRRSDDSPEYPKINTLEIPQYAPVHPSTRSWEIPRENVTIEKIIGKGAFGQVAKGTAVGLQGRPPKTEVAVKMLKAAAPESDRKDLLSELEVMKTLKPHPHIIKLLGCVTKSEPMLVLIEYVPYGDLLGYLRKSRGLNDTYYKDPDIKPQTSLTSQQLMKFAWQIADGMSYLSSRSIIHRDLAARNVLVGEGETCKVTDFGMARDVQQENNYERKTKGRLPVKWTAYEALLYGTYTTKSDVWSYGILLYEIFTIGGSPYPRMEARKIVSLLEQGYRMPKPNHVEDKLYKIMMACWKEDANERPAFADLRNNLKQMENQHKRLINMKMYDTHQYANVEDLCV